MRLARFNIQSGSGRDKRYFVGMPSPAAAGDSGGDGLCVSVGTVRLPRGAAGAPVVLVPAVLMVSTIRFRSFKTIDLQSRRPYTVLILVAGAIVAICAHPRAVLVVMAYSISRPRSSAWGLRVSSTAAVAAAVKRRLPAAPAPTRATALPARRGDLPRIIREPGGPDSCHCERWFCS